MAHNATSFTDGNQAALRHGLYVKSPNGRILRDRRVRRLVRKMYAACPWLDLYDETTLRAWAEIEIMLAAVSADLRSNGVSGPGGEPRKLLTEYRMLRSTQLQFARELRLPSSTRQKARAASTLMGLLPPRRPVPEVQS